MKKFFLILFGILALLACGPRIPVSVISVVITPPGDTTSATLTAKIETEGQGKLRVEWMNASYDSVSISKKRVSITSLLKSSMFDTFATAWAN